MLDVLPLCEENLEYFKGLKENYGIDIEPTDELVELLGYVTDLYLVPRLLKALEKSKQPTID